MFDQLAMLNTMGCAVPGGANPTMLEVYYGNTRQEFVGDSLQKAIKMGQDCFPGLKLDIIFVNLPNKGAPAACCWARVQCKPTVLLCCCGAGLVSSDILSTAWHRLGQAAAVVSTLIHSPCAGAELYQEVKRATDSFCGIPSQCFVSMNAGIANTNKLRGRPQYAANVALKAST